MRQRSADVAEPRWWRQPAGVPAAVSDPDRRSRLIAAACTVAFVLGATGVAAAVRHDGDGALRPFCDAYFGAATSLVSPPSLSAEDVDRPDVQRAIAEEERAFALARRSGNERIQTAFAAFEQVLNDAAPGGGTPAESQARAERFGTTFQASFSAAVEECHDAGYLEDPAP
jgi:hypothetical protein